MANISKRFPSIPHMKKAARWRIPGFAWDYMTGGIGVEENVRRNMDDLQKRYLNDVGAPDISTKVFGQEFSAPFGVAPIGLAGLQWPGIEPPIARAARAHNIVHVLSTHATTSLEKMKMHSGPNGWFQLYPPNDAKMEADMIDRAKRAGYEVLVVTVDIPAVTRRDRDIRNGLSVPPQLGLRTAFHAAMRPHWLLRLAKHGIPHFENLEPYAPPGLSVTEFGTFLGKILAGHITPERFKRIRDQWPGKVIVKGILDPEEAAAYLALGADGIVVSNHGGRQLDAARYPKAGRAGCACDGGWRRALRAGYRPDDRLWGRLCADGSTVRICLGRHRRRRAGTSDRCAEAGTGRQHGADGVFKIIRSLELPA
jgi:isopentenyl diphosphate isomerase/L-lactate dehydrogenase-like FMN-dependent dehydrogenase